MLYDVFISHASEDKENFVKPLAQALRDANVSVWYDEFELKVGMGLRSSIEKGLSKSRFGIVVLSKAFFRKKWPQWELDGLVQRQLSVDEPVILPIWLDVVFEDVFEFSCSLANLKALIGDSGIDNILKKLIEVIKPQGSSLVIARDRLIELGYSKPPVVTDDWWHKAIEYCGSNEEEGTFQEPMGWGHWGFPLSERGVTARERGERIAWAVLQMNWQEIAESRQISQITHPDEVHKFINEMPGLELTCLGYPGYLASYAPQLTIPGFGGKFEEIFDEWLEQSRIKCQQAKKCKTNYDNIRTCDESIALHDPNFGNCKSASIACNFVQGELMGPSVKVYDTIDYIFWFLSDASNWMPENVKQFLIKGLKDWGAWPTSLRKDINFGRFFLRSLQNSKSISKFKMTKKASVDLDVRIEYSKNKLSLPESIKEIRERFLSNGFIETYIEQRMN
jgi:hypothetical protein